MDFFRLNLLLLLLLATLSVSFNSSAGDGVKWSVDVDRSYFSNIAIGHNGLLHISSGDEVHSYSPLGDLEWSFSTDSTLQSAPVIGVNGLVYIGDYLGNLYSITPDGKLNWRVNLGSPIDKSVSIDKDGIIYVVSTETIYAITADGNIKWYLEMDSFLASSASIDKAGNIYIGTGVGLYAVSSDGTILWFYATDGAISSQPAIDSEGIVYVGSYDQYFYAINPDGELKWSIHSEGIVSNSAAIDINGVIVFVSHDDVRADISHDNKLNAVSTEGELLWVAEIDGNNGAPPTIREDGIIILGSGREKLLFYDLHGQLNRTVDMVSKVHTAVSIDDDGTLYAGNVGQLTAVDGNGYGLAGSSWSKIGGNNQNSGCDCGEIVLWDTDGDGLSDDIDPDDDNDGVDDFEDAFPLNAREYVDTDGDGIGDNADKDDDNDGIPDLSDADDTNDGIQDADGGLRWSHKDYGWYSAFSHERYGWINRSPAISDDGTIYITAGRFLRAFDPQGNLEWEFVMNTQGASPTVGMDDKIYIGGLKDPAQPSNPNFYAVNPDGTLAWQRELPAGAHVTSSVAVSTDGTIYFGTKSGEFISVTPEGDLNWYYMTGGVVSSPAIATDGTVYVSSEDGDLYAFTAEGKLKWKYFFNSTLGFSSGSPAVDIDGTVYVSYNGLLYAISENGKLKWKTYSGKNSIAIGNDGLIYVTDKGSIKAYRRDGSLEWSILADNIYTRTLSSPTIARDGTIFFGSDNGILYAVDPARAKAKYTQQFSVSLNRSLEDGEDGNGVLKWIYNVGGRIQSSPTITQDGTILVGTHIDPALSDGPRFFAINSTSGPLARSPWPKQGRNIDNSAQSTPSIPDSNLDGSSDAIDLDDDNDGVYDDVDAFPLDPSESMDSDGDGIGNNQDTDNDNDGTPDIIDAKPFSRDTQIDKHSNIQRSKLQIPYIRFKGSQTAIATDGAVYYAAAGKVFAALPSGKMLWEYNMGDSIYRPIIGSDGAVIVANRRKIHAFNKERQLTWTYYGEHISSFDTPPSIASDGTVYIAGSESSGGQLYAIYKGELKWQYSWENGFKPANTSAISIAGDGTIYVGLENNGAGMIMAFYPDGSLKWRLPLDSRVFTAIAINDGGSLVVGGYNGDLYCISSGGTIEWTFHLGTNTPPRTSPVIANDGSIYLATDSVVYAIDRNGFDKWRFDPLHGSPVSPIIAEDGTVYFAAGSLYAFSPDGAHLWTTERFEYSATSLNLSDEGTVYVSTHSKYTYEFEGEAGGLASSPWPKEGYDSGNSGQIRISDSKRVAYDHDGDGKADIAVRRPSTKMWYILNSSDGVIQRESFGRQSEDIPVPADYDGDGKADIAVRRPSTKMWYILNSSDGVIQRESFGRQSEDIPVPADYDGDGKADIAVRRPSTKMWYILNSSDGVIQRESFGRQSEDIPVPADYDGDGKVDIAVRRPSTKMWYILNSSDGVIQRESFGRQSEDIPVPADYDGDGKADIAVRRPSTKMWYILNSSDGVIQGISFGRKEDIPVPADYDGDGKADIAVRRPSTKMWYILNSSDGVIQGISFGRKEDIPVAAPVNIRTQMATEIVN